MWRSHKILRKYITASDVWSVERAHDLHNMSGISEEAVPVDWAHCEERSLGSFAAKSDFKFGQICSFAHLPAIKMQSVWNYPFWLCFAVLVTALIILENLNITLFLPLSDLRAFVDLQQYNHQRHNLHLHGKSVRRERICEQYTLLVKLFNFAEGSPSPSPSSRVRKRGDDEQNIIIMNLKEWSTSWRVS